ncbi:hypothetical protein [Bordetella genomosp. 1]|uniref:CdiA C-terminal domain-containing protein n=1 Tax=Bordetella genomosp. 1 TaxID=1395607 RepID=UPI00114100D0|nr:hypothetical protein [Bordetella genomosp. 1]
MLDSNAVAAVNNSARLELENNQFALPLPGMAGSGGALGGVGKRGTGAGDTNRQRLGSDSGDELSADDNIALRLTRAWNALFGTDSGPEGAAGPLETPAVPPGGDTRVPGYPGDSRQSEQTPAYESDQGNLGTPGLQADSNKHQGGSVTPLPEQQGPQLIPSEGANKGSLSGLPTRIPPLSDEVTTRSLELENQSAIALAKNGFEVIQNPVVPGPKNPDYLVNGQIFDNYAPSTGNVRNIAHNISDKVAKGQADNIVVNLTDSSATPDALQTQLTNYPIPGLKQVIAIDKTGAVVRLSIKRN